jgi:hypothetical protein
VGGPAGDECPVAGGVGVPWKVLLQGDPLRVEYGSVTLLSLVLSIRAILEILVETTA